MAPLITRPTNAGQIVSPRRYQSLADGLSFEADEIVRLPDRVLVASGSQSRNRDPWTGKHFRLSPPGIRLDGWRKNGRAEMGQMLWMHNFMIPLGLADMVLEDGRLWANKMKFHRMKIPVMADKFIGDAIGEFDTAVIADLWDMGFLNAVSIHIILGLQDEENIVETDEEIFIPTGEGIEFSVVTIPGDREATRDKMEVLGVDRRVAEALLREKEAPQLGGAITVSPVSKTEVSSVNEEFEDVEGADVYEEEEVESGLASLVVEEVEGVEAESAAEAITEYNVNLDPVQIAEALGGNEAFLNRLAELVAARISLPQAAAATPAFRVNLVNTPTSVPAQAARPATPRTVPAQSTRPAARPAQKAASVQSDPALGLIRSR